jgi:hypothetical protein
MKIKWVTRNGQKIVQTMTVQQATKRLEYLNEVERKTVECAPTDSGQTRFDYNQEAKAIREALSLGSLKMHVTAFDKQLEAERAQRLANDFALLDAQSEISALAKVQSNETTN